MKIQDQFCLGVRLLGVWEILTGLHEAVYFLPVVRESLHVVEQGAYAYLYHALSSLFLGAVLLQGGPLFARLLFPDAPVASAEIEQQN